MEKIIVGNLKMNLEEDKIKEYVRKIKEVHNDKIKLFLAPTFLYLNEFINNKYELTAQNLSSYDDGDYTGEVSASQLKSIGVSSVIIGHSERRILFNETDEVINNKIKMALENNLNVILCIGNKDKGEIDAIVSELIDILKLDLNDINDLSKIIVAYEPIYAINNGNSESVEVVEKVIKKLKEYFNNNYNSDIKIIYGGSVNEDNICEFSSICDGVIIGKNSLDPDKFISMIEKVN